MQEGPINAATANSLVQGYCDDFVALAAVLAQTLEQASMRSVDLRPSRVGMQRIEQGMRGLADAIRELLDKQAPMPKAATAATAPAAPAAAKDRPRAATSPELAKPRSSNQTRTLRPTGRPMQRGGVLQGTTQSMPLLSVFQFVGRMRKTGTMHVHLPKEEMAFVLESGCIVFATTDRLVNEERLGDILIELESCTREQLDRMKELAAVVADDLFGQQVIETGVVTRPQVLKALEAQTKRRFSRCCKVTEASYEFVEGLTNVTDSMFRFQPVAIA